MSICSPSLVLKAGERSHAKALFGEAGEEVASRLNLCAIITFLFRQKKHLCTFHCCFLGHCFSLSRMVVPAMATKMKGIYKSFKCISQIFVVKEREMEIGYPTDVKHVAHIGWDGQSGTAPSWMHEFKTAPDFSSSIGNSMDSNALSTWSSQDFEQSMGRQPASDMFKDASPTDVPNIPKKHKRKKKSSTCSPKSSSSRTLRGAKSKATFNEKETANLQV